ncbi:MAG: methionine adenosyltransferase [Chloroflexi bacterium]|nr:methionine adenosyltransferase [Chloroflexota bacterium]
MSTSFYTSPRLLFTSESVTEGHPDKVCDQISDAVLDWCLAQSPGARVACETSIKSDDDADRVIVFGEVSPLPDPAVVRDLVRTTLREIGYVERAQGCAADTAEIAVYLTGQSADIALGVDHSLEAKQSGEVALDTGAGDQGMMVGFACDETPELMPLPISLAHRLAQRLTALRKDGTLAYLRPDGKSQVTVQYAHGRPARLDAVVVSAQHDDDVGEDRLQADVSEQVVRQVVPAGLLDSETRIFVNPTGRFVLGGPYADSGLTGRKIIVDTYGGMARHGGGAFSGKDPTKVDRSASYAARWVAKHVVAAGLASRCEVQLAYAIGVAHPVSVSVETFGTGTVPDAAINRAIVETFDLRPAAIIRDLELRRPIFRQTAAYGHFGRVDIDVPWERTQRVEALRQAATSGSAAQTTR